MFLAFGVWVWRRIAKSMPPAQTPGGVGTATKPGNSGAKPPPPSSGPMDRRVNRHAAEKLGWLDELWDEIFDCIDKIISLDSRIRSIRDRVSLELNGTNDVYNESGRILDGIMIDINRKMQQLKAFKDLEELVALENLRRVPGSDRRTKKLYRRGKRIIYELNHLFKRLQEMQPMIDSLRAR